METLESLVVSMRTDFPESVQPVNLAKTGLCQIYLETVVGLFNSEKRSVELSEHTSCIIIFPNC